MSAVTGYFILGSSQFEFVSPTVSNNSVIFHNFEYVNTTNNFTGTTSMFNDFDGTLAGYWSFETYNSSGVFDNSTYNNFGSFDDVTSGNITAGQFGNGMNFLGNGYSNIYVSGSSPSLVDTTDGSFTFEVWARPYNTTVSNPQYALARTGTHTGLRYWSNINKWSFNIWNSTGSETYIQSDLVYPNGQWQHVVGVVNDTEKKAYLYVNGILAAESKSYTGSLRDYGTANYYIGCGSPVSATVNHTYNGTVDEVRIWNRALSLQEINASFNSTANNYFGNFTGLPDKMYNYTMWAVDSSGSSVRATNYFTVDSNAIFVDRCTVLDQSNKNYYLNASIINTTSSVNCMNITANNVTLDCRGYSMAGTTTGTTFGVRMIRDPMTYTNAIVRNCNISGFDYGINFNTVRNNTIQNNTISAAYGIYLESRNNSVIGNSISVSESWGMGIYLYASQAVDNRLRNNSISIRDRQQGFLMYTSSLGSHVEDIDESNTINGKPMLYMDGINRPCANNSVWTNGTSYGYMDFVRCNNITIRNGLPVGGIQLTGTTNSLIENIWANGMITPIMLTADANYNVIRNLTSFNNTYGFRVYAAYQNSIESSSIYGSTTYDYLYEGGQATMNFTNTNFTTRTIRTSSNVSWFNYKNDTSELRLRSNVGTSSGTTTTRTLNSWSMTNMSWNDSTSLAVTMTYNISGLVPNTSFDVFNSSSKAYTITSDSTGSISFSIDMNDTSRQIMVNTTDPKGCTYIPWPFNSTYVMNQNNTYYCLAQGAYFVGINGINATNIHNSTLDCQGNMIESDHMSNTIGTYFEGSSNITIKNCLIDGFRWNIDLYNTNKSMISNNTLTGGTDVGIRLEASSNNTLANNTATANSYGIRLYTFSSYNNLTSNTVTNTVRLVGNCNYNNLVNTVSNAQVYLEGSYANSIVNGSASSYVLRNCGNANNFTSANFTASRTISFINGNEGFNYANYTNGLWLKNNVSAPTTITRILSNWTQTGMIWNDSADASIVSTYSLSGLLPITNYTISNFSSALLTATTSSTGDLVFSMNLNSTSREIRVETNPPLCQKNIEWMANSTYLMNQSNTYYCLSQDWYIAGTSAINASSVQNSTLDCQGFRLSGNNSNAYAIFFNGTSTNNTIKNCNISQFFTGIYLNSDNNTLKNNTVSITYNNGYGIYLNRSNTMMTNNTVMGRDYFVGVQLSSSSNNTLMGNNVTGTNANVGWGFYIQSGSNNTLLNNTFHNNGVISIYLSSSSNNTLADNRMYPVHNQSSRFQEQGLYVAGTDINYFRNSIPESNTINGLPVLYIDGIERQCQNNTVYTNGSSYGYMGFVGCDNLTIRDSSPTDHLMFAKTTNSLITNLNISYSMLGAYLTVNSNNNTITNCIFSNEGAHSVGAGLTLSQSAYETVVNNTFNNNGYIGLRAWQSYHDTAINNTANSNGYVSIVFNGGSNVTLINNTANNGYVGINVNQFNTYRVINNTLEHNQGGISISAGSFNGITSGGSIWNNSQYDFNLEIGTNDSFIDTNFTSARKIRFSNTASYFYYSNSSTGPWSNTSVSAATTITRTLNSWSMTNMSWNDSASTEGTAIYVLKGLLPSAQYTVYNSSAPSTAVTDLSGTLIISDSLNSTSRQIGAEADTAPHYSDYQSHLTTTYSPSGYSNFTVTWSNSTPIDGVYLENNFSGALNNSTMLGDYPNYYYNSTPLGAGAYEFRFISNSTMGNSNSTPLQELTIGKASQPMVLTNSTPLTGTYPHGIEISGLGNLAEAVLYRNGTEVPNPESVLLAYGTYNYSWISNGNENYSANSTFAMVSISKGTPSLFISDIVNGTYPYPQTIVVTSSVSGLPISLMFNGTAYQNDTENVYPAGLWNITAYTNGNQNYTSALAQEWNLIEKGNASVSTYPLTSSIVYGNTINQYCVGSIPCSLYRNGTEITNNTEDVLGAGAYLYKANVSDTQNYTNYEATSVLTVNKTIPSIELSFSTPISYGTTSQVGCTRSASDQSAVLTLYRNGTQVASGMSSPIVELLSVLSAGAYNYTCVVISTQNYTSASVQDYLIVSQSVPQMFISFNGIQSNLTVQYPNSTNVTAWESNLGDGGCVYTLYANASEIGNGTIVSTNVSHGAGAYEYAISTSGCTNYTSASIPRTLVISKGMPSLFLVSNVTWLAAYPNASNITGYGCPVAGASDVNCTLFRNTTGSNPVGSGDAVSENELLNATAHLYVYNTSGGQNWSASSVSSILLIGSCGNGVCDQGETHSSCSADCAAPQTSSPSSGSSSVVWIAPSSASQPTLPTQAITLQSDIGGYKSQPFSIVNNNYAPMTVQLSVEGDISSFVTLQSSEITIGPRENITESLNLFVSSNAEPGTYSGNIVVKSGSQTQKIYVVVLVGIDTEQLLDVKVDITGSKDVIPGKDLSYQTSVFNFGSTKKVDVFINYTIRKASTNETVLVSAETLAVETSLSVTRMLNIPQGTEPGAYTLEAVGYYENKTAYSLASFRVIRAISFEDYAKSGLIAGIVILAVVAYERLCVNKSNSKVKHAYKGFRSKKVKAKIKTRRNKKNYGLFRKGSSHNRRGKRNR